GVARSLGDPGVWHDEKPLWITHRSYTFNPLTESPEIFRHNSTWFLFVTTSAGQPLTFYTSQDPTGDPAAWTYRGRLKNMLGYDTGDWYTSEVLHDGDLDLFAVSTSESVVIKTIVWGIGDNFSLTDPLFFHMVSMGWSRSTIDENRYIALKLKAVNGYAYHQPLVAWTKDATGTQFPLSMSGLGIPDNPDLSQDSLVVRWFTRRWPPSRPADQPMKLRIATADGTGSTGWLTIYPNSVDQPAASGPGGTVEEQPDAGIQPEVSPNPPPVPEDTLAYGMV